MTYAFALTEKQLARKILQVLDGTSISKAKNALSQVSQLLDTSQIVNANSPLLQIEDLTE